MESENELPNRKKSDDESDKEKPVNAFGMRSIIETSTGITAHCTVFERRKENPDEK